MLHDTMRHRRMRGQSLFSARVPMPSEAEERLREFMRKSKSFAKSKSLSAGDVAKAVGDIGKLHVLYSVLSADAVHPSVDALSRYVISEEGELSFDGIDFDPAFSESEVLETIEMLCTSALSCAVYTRDIVFGEKPPRIAIDDLGPAHLALLEETRH